MHSPNPKILFVSEKTFINFELETLKQIVQVLSACVAQRTQDFFSIGKYLLSFYEDNFNCFTLRLQNHTSFFSFQQRSIAIIKDGRKMFTKGTVINLKQTDNAMAKNEKKKKNQTTAHMTQHRKLKNKQHEPHQKLGVISGAPEGKADPAPHVEA